MEKLYQENNRNTRSKRVNPKKKAKVLAAIKDPIRPIRATSIYQRVERVLALAEAGTILVNPFSTIPQSQLTRALNDLVRDKKIILTSLDGDITIRVVTTSANKNNGGEK